MGCEYALWRRLASALIQDKEIKQWWALFSSGSQEGTNSLSEGSSNVGWWFCGVDVCWAEVRAISTITSRYGDLSQKKKVQRATFIRLPNYVCVYLGVPGVYRFSKESIVSIVLRKYNQYCIFFSCNKVVVTRWFFMLMELLSKYNYYGHGEPFELWKFEPLRIVVCGLFWSTRVFRGGRFLEQLFSTMSSVCWFLSSLRYTHWYLYNGCLCERHNLLILVCVSLT